MTHIITPEGARPLSCGEKLILYALSNEHGRLGDYAECSLAQLAHWCRLSIEGVRKLTRALERDKAVHIDRPKVSHPGATFRYVVIEANLCHQNQPVQGELSTPLRVHSVQPKGWTELTHIPKATKSNLNTGEVGSLSGTSEKQSPLELSSGDSEKQPTGQSAQSDHAQKTEKPKYKAVVTELRAILEGTDVNFGLLGPKQLLEAWEAKGERQDISLLPPVVRKVIRGTIWRRVADPAAQLVKAVKLEARTVWLHQPESSHAMSKVQ